MPPKKRSNLGRNTATAARRKRRRLTSQPADKTIKLRSASTSRQHDATASTSNEAAPPVADPLNLQEDEWHQRPSTSTALPVEAQYESRLLYNRNRLSQQRAAELSDERNFRLMVNRQRSRAVRAAETDDDRHCRLMNERQRRRDHANALNQSQTLRLAAFNYDPLTPYSEHKKIAIGGLDVVCQYCSAQKFRGEAPGMCCKNGKVSMPPLPSPPEELGLLMSGTTSDSKHFLANIRRYNSCFQMTSFGTSSPNPQQYIPTTFKIQGQVYHKIGALLPSEASEPKFIQIYFMDDHDASRQKRCNLFPGLRPDIIAMLQRMFDTHNALIRIFKTALERMPSDEYKIIIRADKRPTGEHGGRFNAPTTDEVAVVISTQEGYSRDIILQKRGGQLSRISETHRCYDALQYPVIFPRGEDGYHLNIPQVHPLTRLPSPKMVTAMAYYAFRIMIRIMEINFWLLCRQLSNQLLVDAYAKVEAERLLFFRLNQSKLRVEEYIHLRDAVIRDGETQDIGQLCILPSTFVGSPRHMHEYTQDAMTYVRHYGTPDLFITFTCNPAWDEIKALLSEGQNPSDRHDVVARVFRQKHLALIHALTKYHVFGEARCWMYTIEFQKRGLPHSHNLIWLRNKIRPCHIDQIISAEIPDAQSDPDLHQIILKNMVHGPCGPCNQASPCMKDGICSKKYPREFLKETLTGSDGYPKYRRRSLQDGGYTAVIHRRNADFEIDNRWIVPYSPLLSKMFNAHINVEYCNSVKSIKYICKYVTKGNDMAMFGFGKTNIHDEITQYQLGRYICSNEAVWRILSFPIHERYPTVQHLSVHLENGQRVYFTQANMGQRALQPPGTTLTAFFELCREDPFARTLLYPEVPRYYTFNKTRKIFCRRKAGTPVPGHSIFATEALGRVYTVHPNNAECFFLRLLLHAVRGPTSFDAIKTVNGQRCETFRQACQSLGLLEDDRHWDQTINEAQTASTPSQLRFLFAIILTFSNPSHPKDLWQAYREAMSEDILHRLRRETGISDLPPNDDVFNSALILLEDLCLQMSNKSLDKLGLSSPARDQQNSLDADYIRETSYDRELLRNRVDRSIPMLNTDQREVFNTVMDKVNHQRHGIIFLDAPGGTGKTFVTNLILAQIRSTGSIAIAVASSGIAATLLDGGRTAHATLKLPLNIAQQDFPVCNISKRAGQARLLQSCRLIVWDECTMAHKKSLEALQRTLQDLRGNQQLMGGALLLLCGDFRQTLPIIPRATPADEINACLKFSILWPEVETLHLRINMRVTAEGPAAEQFANILLAIGEGKHETILQSEIQLTHHICNLVSSIPELIDKIYPNIRQNFLNHDWLRQRAILAPRNEDVDDINSRLLQSLPGEIVRYLSIDSTVEAQDAVHYPTEFLNAQNPPGIPPHALHLKIGAPIMLLRNMNPPLLCNGTRLCVTKMFKYSIQATILTGVGAGNIVLLPRIPLIPSDLPFQFKRLQIPIRLAFSMTINKSQGQSIPHCGLNLTSPCFSHGQLYVAISRVGSPDNLIVCAPNGKTTNIVYPEVL